MSSPDNADAPAKQSLDQTRSFGGKSTDSGIEVGGALRFAPPTVEGEVGTLGRYRIQKLLGQGGMGAVYLAYDEKLQRSIALKVMLPKSAANVEAKARFLREARSAAQIASEHVVATYDADELDGVPFIALQFLEGMSLDACIASKGKLRTSQIIRIGREIALGLIAAHKLGLVHRDIKPSNVWIEAPTGRVKILDFGLAKSIGGGSIELTGTGDLVGTPAYMAPEQARGDKVDPRTDLYSFGALMYRLCTGELPIKGDTATALIMSLAVDEPQPIRELNPEIPEALAVLIHQMLAKKPEKRPKSAQVVADRLKEIAASQSAKSLSAATTADTAKPKTHSWIPFVGVGVVALTLLLGCGGGGLLLYQIVIIRDKQGDKIAEIKVPKDDKLDNVEDKKPSKLPKNDNVEDKDAKEKKLAEASRAAAKYALSVGGTVRCVGIDRSFRGNDELPAGPFEIIEVFFRDNQQVSDDGLAAFVDCRKLTVLDLVNTPVTDAGVTHFRNCKDLIVLDLVRSPVGDASLTLLAGNTKLRFLWLGNTKVTDDTLKAFAGNRELSHLDVCFTAVGDAGVANCKEWRNLKFLALQGSKVSTAGLANFANCDGLETLHLHETSLDDKAIANLSRFAKLKLLTIQNTQITRDGFEQLKQALPSCKIESDHGTYDPN